MERSFRDLKKERNVLSILNTREKKPLLGFLESQWGCDLDFPDTVFLLHNNDRLYAAHSDMGMIDLEELRVDHVGLYLGTVEEDGIRLSIEGSQIVGPRSKKNILEVSAEERDAWLRGGEISVDEERMSSLSSRYVLLRCGDDFVGSGKLATDRVMNFVPKGRRMAGPKA